MSPLVRTATDKEINLLAVLQSHDSCLAGPSGAEKLCDIGTNTAGALSRQKCQEREVSKLAVILHLSNLTEVASEPRHDADAQEEPRGYL